MAATRWRRAPAGAPPGRWQLAPAAVATSAAAAAAWLQEQWEHEILNGAKACVAFLDGSG